ncbi:MAG: glycosyltransferase family 39 protein [Anaerolineae bacterium]|nr:glycosyltransferase family 39 protein [Anaerolineae bacterium]
MKRQGWWLLLILLLAAGLRFFRLGARSLWFDEALSVLIGRLRLWQVLTGAAGSSHPPGYYLLLHAWQAAGMGSNDWLLRYPSVFASLLSVALVYRVGSLLFDRRAGLLAAFGMALAPFQVYYAQEARMYALATALTLGSTWCFIRMVKQSSVVGACMGYVLCTTLGLYTHYFVAWVVLSLHLWLLLAGRRFRGAWRPILFADLLVGLVFLPQVVQFIGQTDDYLGGEMAWQARPHPLLPLTTLEYLLFGHSAGGALWWWGVRVAVVLLVAAVVALELMRRRDRARRRWGALPLLTTLFPLFAVVAISWLAAPIYLERSFAMLAPFLVLFIAQGAAMAPSRVSPTPWLGILLAGLLAIGGGVHFAAPDIAKPPVREAMAVVAADFREGDLCLHVDETYLTALVYEPVLGPALWHIDAWRMRPETYRVLGGRLVTPEEALEAEGRLWLVVAGRSSQPWEGFLGQIEQERQLGDSWEWEFLSVYRYD